MTDEKKVETVQDRIDYYLGHPDRFLNPIELERRGNITLLNELCELFDHYARFMNEEVRMHPETREVSAMVLRKVGDILDDLAEKTGLNVVK